MSLDRPKAPPPTPKSLRVATLRACARLLWPCLGLLPLTLRRSLGRIGGRLFATLPTRERQVAQAQLHWIFPDQDSATLARDVFIQVGQTLAECCDLGSILAQQTVAIEETTPTLRDIHKQCPSLLILSAHLSNWELLAAFQAQSGVPLTVVGREANSPALHDALAGMRERWGVKTIWRGDPGAARALLHTLRRGGVVAGLVDQDTKVASIPVPFFGHPAMTPTSLVDMAKRTNAAIVTLFIVRTSPDRYRIELHRIPSEASISEILQQYNALLEEIIRRYPEQWPWFHKRWRTQGETTLSTARYLQFLQGTSP